MTQPYEREGAYRADPKNGKALKRTVVKVNYRLRSTGGKNAVKASSEYYCRRENIDGEKQDRELFTKKEEGINRSEAGGRINQMDEENPTYYYRAIMSPGASSSASEEELVDWTRDVMRNVDAKDWIAVAHSDSSAHTPHGHVHVIYSTDTKLDSKKLDELREIGTEKWSESFTYQTELAQKETLEQTQISVVKRETEVSESSGEGQ